MSRPLSVHAKTPCPPPDVLELMASGRGSTDEVRFHVDACDSCRALLDEMRTNQQFLDAFRPALGSGSGQSPGSPALPLSPDINIRGERAGGGSGGSAGARTGILSSLPGSVEIPGYHNVVEVSRGGQGVVYKGVHAITKRKVAIKMLLRGAYATPRELHRFEREIEIVAALRHPNIVTVFDSGVTPDQRPFIVMEYIHGLPLDKYVKEKLAQATKRTRWIYEPHLRLFARIAAAVQHAHSRGVIHRDLKPGNVLVDDAGEPHIVDFGMARVLSLSRGPTPTMTHEFGGTLAYASPEQVAGDPERIDVRTDVYSLGVILYELLTGEYPYDIGGPISEVLRNIEHAEPVRPSSVEPSIGYEVETIILKALAKEPERRYLSAGELARDVEDFLAGKPISARSASTWYLMRKMARRHKAGVLMGGVVAVLALAAGAAAVVADREAMFGRGIKEGFQRIYGALQVGRGNVTPRDRFRTILDVGESEVDAAFGADATGEALVREHLGMGYWELDDFAKSEKQYKRVLALREAAGAPLKETGGLRIQLARLCLLQSPDRWEDVHQYLSKDVLQSIRATGDVQMLSEAMRPIASLQLFTSPAQAIATLEAARAPLLDVSDGGIELECVEDALAAAHFGVGERLAKQGARDKAAESYLKALELYTTVLEKSRQRVGENHVRYASVLDSVADCELKLERPAQALEHYKTAHRVYRRFFIPPDPRLTDSLRQLAEASKAVGRTADAETYTELAEQMAADLAAEASKK